MKNPIPIDRAAILKRYKPVATNAHKGIQGHALLIGGSYGKMGSVCLSSKAAIKTGCGLVTAFVPKCGYEIVQISIPEVMVLTDEKEKYLSEIHYDFIPNAIGIGMGIGQELPTQKALHDFLLKNKSPLVIDADALNILSLNPKWLPLVPQNTILTPHPKELERLIGKWTSDEEKMEKTIAFSKTHNVIVVMKGAPTHIVAGETVYKNTTGNPALATAGSGDVLTGIITSLLAQSYTPLDAALLGVYLHGLTADIALPETGHESFIASTIIATLGKAFLSLAK
ncbi:NAD(P)H-hydrate dehydratase [Flavobacterium psychrotolerans]|uniref:ADP-dependent (S)-NAD(P)H-hydrate dehydratase n=1 Tax=Flavobacterium psychrotolerans TaxID=2169410 RepID=A0A2U1JHE9_9FLAO|nr:NAD(P)H-hydrate dehydratase [Flavobacterium psychrotolerans]PWA04358.1 NAD(P)H-hydrate dehydratase [Flavobacterium psychrotolerans]